MIGEPQVSERQLSAVVDEIDYKLRTGDDQVEQRLNAAIRELRALVNELSDRLTSEAAAREEERANCARLAVGVSRAKVERHRAQGAPLVAIAAVEATGADIEHAILHGVPEVQ